MCCNDSCPDPDESGGCDVPVERPYYEVVVRVPLDDYDEAWFDRVSAAAGRSAAISGHIVTGTADVVADGFGSTWERCSPDCDLEVVRPGKAQCSCR